MGSGLIYAGIVVAWAAVLVPMWLRRSDLAGESRSVDRFAQAMRVLSRRVRDGEATSRTRPDEPTDAEGQGPGTHRRRAALPTGPARRRSLAARRRRCLLALVVATAGAILLALAGPLPGELGAALAGVLGGYLVHLRSQARRDADLVRARRAATARTEARLRRLNSEDRVVQVRLDAEAEIAAARRAELAAEEAARAEVERLAAERAAAGWLPRSAPLPTYVLQARASRTVRVIDVSSSGRWVEAARSALRAQAEHASLAPALRSGGVESPAPEPVGAAPRAPQDGSPTAGGEAAGGGSGPALEPRQSPAPASPAETAEPAAAQGGEDVAHARAVND